MTDVEKIRLIHDLSRRILEDIEYHIEIEDIPEYWDGVELRQLLADRFAMQVYKMGRRRKREYNNTVIVHNLL